MPDTSQSLSLPFIAPSQAQKHVTHNEALRILDVLTQLAVTSDEATTPPAASEGSRYIVATGATGDWSGHDGEVALFETGTWRFFVPRAGWRAYVLAREALAVHDGEDWIDLDSADLQDVEEFGLGMMSDAANPFAAKLNSALWTALYSADGGTGGLIQTLNKENSADDVGFVFQKDFETRALLGLFGNDNIRLATSTDGINFRDAMIVDAATGALSQPSLPRFKGTTNFDNFAVADTWVKLAINVTDFNDQAVFDAGSSQFTAPANGTYAFGAVLTFRENASDQSRMSARLVLNGVTQISGSLCENTGSHITDRTTLCLQSLVSLSAGDTVELQGQMRNFDAYFMGNETSFWGYKVG
ncbi:MAG: DUF2793 domain-containing protein [Pseudomonadota bacterium]